MQRQVPVGHDREHVIHRQRRAVAGRMHQLVALARDQTRGPAREQRPGLHFRFVQVAGETDAETVRQERRHLQLETGNLRAPAIGVVGAQGVAGRPDLRVVLDDDHVLPVEVVRGGHDANAAVEQRRLEADLVVRHVVAVEEETRVREIPRPDQRGDIACGVGLAAGDQELGVLVHVELHVAVDVAGAESRGVVEVQEPLFTRPPGQVELRRHRRVVRGSPRVLEILLQLRDAHPHRHLERVGQVVGHLAEHRILLQEVGVRVGRHHQQVVHQRAEAARHEHRRRLAHVQRRPEAAGEILGVLLPLGVVLAVLPERPRRPAQPAVARRQEPELLHPAFAVGIGELVHGDQVQPVRVRDLPGQVELTRVTRCAQAEVEEAQELSAAGRMVLRVEGPAVVEVEDIPGAVGELDNGVDLAVREGSQRLEARPLEIVFHREAEDVDLVIALREQPLDARAPSLVRLHRRATPSGSLVVAVDAPGQRKAVTLVPDDGPPAPGVPLVVVGLERLAVVDEARTLGFPADQPQRPPVAERHVDHGVEPVRAVVRLVHRRIAGVHGAVKLGGVRLLVEIADRAALRSFAEQRALRTLQHFDALDVEEVAADLGVRTKCGRHRRAVEVDADRRADDEVLGGAGLRGQAADRVPVLAIHAAGHGEPWYEREDVLHALGADGLDEVVGDGVDGLRGVHQVRLPVGGGHDDLLHRCRGRARTLHLLFAKHGARRADHKRRGRGQTESLHGYLLSLPAHRDEVETNVPLRFPGATLQ